MAREPVVAVAGRRVWRVSPVPRARAARLPEHRAAMAGQAVRQGLRVRRRGRAVAVARRPAVGRVGRWGGRRRRFGRGRSGGGGGVSGRGGSGGAGGRGGASGVSGTGGARPTVTASPGTTLVKVNPARPPPDVRGLGHQPLLVGEPRRRLERDRPRRGRRRRRRSDERARLSTSFATTSAAARTPRTITWASGARCPASSRRTAPGTWDADANQRAVLQRIVDARARRDRRGVLELAAVLDDEERLRLGQHRRLATT